MEDKKTQAMAKEIAYRIKLRKAFKESTELQLQITLDEILKEINKRSKK